MSRQINFLLLTLFLLSMKPALSATVPNGVDGEQDCLAFPKERFNFDALDKSVMRTFIPNLRYVINPQHLSFTSHSSDKINLRQRFIPSSKGTERVVGVVNLPSRRVYELEQTLLFEDGFDWGGEREGGKIGFGLAGGSAPAGGELEADGFSVRLIWKGNNDGTAQLGAYVYSADRSQNLPWGDVFMIDDWSIPIGTEFKIQMLVKLNSSIEKSNGSFVVSIDDEVKHQKDNIQWQASGEQPVIDQMLYASYYGGSSELWSPEAVTHVQFSDVCATSLPN